MAAIAFDLRIHSSLGIWRQNTFNDTGKARTEDLQRKLFTLSALPRVANGAGAGIGRGVGGELAVELCKQRNAVGEPKLGAGGSQRGVLRRRHAVDDEARAGKRLEPPEAETLTCSWRR